jgi:hypothetical protein
VPSEDRQPPGIETHANHLPSRSLYLRSALVAQKQIRRKGAAAAGGSFSAVIAENVPVDGVFADTTCRDGMPLAATIENQSQVDGGRRTRAKLAVILLQPYGERTSLAANTSV